MSTSRAWVSLVVVFLLCLFFVVPVGAQEGTNLVLNGGFDAEPDHLANWDRDSDYVMGTATDGGPAGRSAPHLTNAVPGQLRYTQCVNTTGLDTVWVGGWIVSQLEGAGNIEITVYFGGDDCGDTDLVPGSLVVMTAESPDWQQVCEEVLLPDDPAEIGTSVQIALFTDQDYPSGFWPYYDDIFLQVDEPTAVLVVSATAKPSVPIWGAAIAAATGLTSTAMIAFRRRRRVG